MNERKLNEQKLSDLSWIAFGYFFIMSECLIISSLSTTSQKMRYLLICKKNISGKCRKIYWEVCGILKLTCRAHSFFLILSIENHTNDMKLKNSWAFLFTRKILSAAQKKINMKNCSDTSWICFKKKHFEVWDMKT